MKYFLSLSIFSLFNILNGINALYTVNMDTILSSVSVDKPEDGYFSSGTLLSHSGLSFRANRNKTLYLNTKSGCSMIASIRMLDLRPQYVDKLILFDAQYPMNAVYFTNQYYVQLRKTDVFESQTFKTSSGSLGVTFQTGPGSTFGYQGFELTFTAQRQAPCRYKEFRCLNSYCISERLKCDGHNHCGDRSEQFNCTNSVGRTVGISIGAVFLIIAAACAVAIILRRRAVRRETGIVVTHRPPQPAICPQPGLYPPQPGTCYPPPPPPYTGVTNPTYR